MVISMAIPAEQPELNRAEARPILDDMTIVIPTLGRPILRESLDCIVKGDAWPRGLIVVDQGRNPQAAQWMDQIRCLGIDAEYAPSYERGRAAGVNRGLERVNTRFVAVTDDDCFVEPDWLANMAERLRANPGAIVTGRVEAAGEGKVMVVTAAMSSVATRPSLTFDRMSGGNMGVSIEVVRRVGLLDEDPRLPTAEDAEWGYRALRSGVPVVYAPEVSVRHFAWRDSAARDRQYRDYARSHGAFYGKYIRRGDLFILARAVVHHGRALRRYVRGLLSRDGDLAQDGRAYLAGLLPGIISGLRADPRGPAPERQEVATS
jgi:GT2 family glycosyltransferase